MDSEVSYLDVPFSVTNAHRTQHVSAFFVDGKQCARGKRKGKY